MDGKTVELSLKEPYEKRTERKVSGGMPVLKIDRWITDEDKKKNLVLVGGPEVNQVTKEFLGRFPVKVSSRYPGAKKGVVEVINNPYANGKYIFLAAGSDRWGTYLASRFFWEGRIQEIALQEKSKEKSFVISESDGEISIE